MTNREAIRIIDMIKCGTLCTSEEAQALILAEIALEGKRNPTVATSYMYHESTCNTKNTASDEGKTDRGMFIPEAEDNHEMDELRFEIQRLKDKEKAQDKRMWFIETKIRELEMRI